MCTVSYIPLSDQSFVLTHSRDETIKRPISSPPMEKNAVNETVLYPIDPKGKGTWIGASRSGRMASLLNGGSHRHEFNPPYKHSRGLIIPEYFNHVNFEHFFNVYDFDGLEPFTLLIFEDNKIYKTVKSENDIKVSILDNSRPYMFTSSSLYPPETDHARRLDFNRWLPGKFQPTDQEILEFHKKHLFEYTKNVYRPDEGHIIKTVSITMIKNSKIGVEMDYYDLVNDMKLTKALKRDTLDKLLENAQ
ncbi:MAG: NRDE family protein [Bacteroidales bacterium]|nr:NRDE family protein [Bacteroidales bacterium]MCF8403436.1 NRDE family protein [Bacteroidales bacterium]